MHTPDVHCAYCFMPFTEDDVEEDNTVKCDRCHRVSKYDTHFKCVYPYNKVLKKMTPRELGQAIHNAMYHGKSPEWIIRYLVHKSETPIIVGDKYHRIDITFAYNIPLFDKLKWCYKILTSGKKRFHNIIAMDEE